LPATPVNSKGKISFGKFSQGKIENLLFSHHLEEPVQLEDIKAKIHAKLWMKDTTFILAEDPKIMELLNEKHDTEILDNISKRLQSLLKTSINDIEPLLVDYVGKPGLATKNYEIFDRKSLGRFHRDGISPQRSMLNVWIALKDVIARPLAFIKSDKFFESSRKGGFPEYDPNDEYIIAPNMKKGQMLLFLASQTGHGSPIIGGDDGARVSASFAYSFLLSPEDLGM
jgi:hypothetical protein